MLPLPGWPTWKYLIVIKKVLPFTAWFAGAGYCSDSRNRRPRFETRAGHRRARNVRPQGSDFHRRHPSCSG